jgi:hypothetical protein
MSASPITSQAIPTPGVAAQFTSGEQALSAPAGAGTLHFALPLYLTGGVYTVKIHATTPFSVWAGADTGALSRVAIGEAGQTLEADFYLRQGQQRISVTLSSASAASWFALSIWQDAVPAYVSTASRWRYDTAPIVDSELPSLGDERLSLPVWAVSPNWSGGVLERLTWKTEVMTSETSVEQRRAMLMHPFRSWEASFLRSNLVRMRLDNFSAGVGSQRFLAPFWPEQFRSRLSGIQSAAHTISLPRGSLYLREVFAGSLLMLDAGDPSLYEIVTVESVSQTIYGDTITLVGTTARSWAIGYRITPVYEVRLNDLPTMTVHTDRTASVTCRFDTVQTIKHITPSWGYYAPLWRYKLDRSSTMSLNYERMVFGLDLGTGPADVVDTSGDTRIGVKANVTLFGRESLSAYRSFLSMARGKAQRFWWPSGTHDMEPVNESLGGLTATFKGTGYSQWITQPQSTRTMVAFMFEDGSPAVYRRIVGVERLSNGNDLFTFDRAIPAMRRDQILRVSFVLPVRFDQDGFELHHVTDDAKAVKAAVVVKSADIDGLPDIE